MGICSPLHKKDTHSGVFFLVAGSGFDIIPRWGLLTMLKMKTRFPRSLVAGSGLRPFNGDLNHSSQKRHPFRCLLSSSGEWIRTTDLRVMRDFPGFGTFFTQAPNFSLA